MPKITFLRGLAAVFVLVTAAMFALQHPGAMGDRLRPAEIDRYLAAAAENLPETAADKADLLRRLRAWAVADDGQPVYMLNLMRYYPRMRALPGGPLASMSPADANAYYERNVTPMLLAKGGSAPFMGQSQGQDVMPFASSGDQWSRMLLIRYPNRRAFLKLVSDPAYRPFAPYKLAALELILAPFSAQMIMPDLSLSTAAVLLIAFLATGWWRAERLLTRR